jgi:group I intron endonuclease
MFIAYSITNKINGKKYIGITTRQPKYRWYEHVYAATKKPTNNIFHNAIRKYGKENFILESLAQTQNLIDLIETEKLLIRQYNTFFKEGQGYNMSLGGEGQFGRIYSEKSRLRMSKSHLGIKFSQEHKDHISQSLKGKLKFAKNWLITIPGNLPINIYSLRKYCNENNISYTAFANTVKNRNGLPIKQGKYKGWTIRQIQMV